MSGNVSIGTTSPTNKLEVAGAIKSTTGGIVFPDGSVQTTSATSGSNNSMVSGWPDAIKCSVTNPAWGTVILYPEFLPFSNGAYYYRAKLATATGAVYGVIFNANGTFNQYENITTSNCADTITNLYSNGLAFNVAKGPAAQWLQNGSTAYYNAGNVGIGTTAPVGVLDVEGSGGVILNAGNVGIGTTAPSQTLDLGGGTIAMGLQIRSEAVTIPSTTNGAWSVYTTACTGTIAYVISSICWRGISTGSALPLRISGNQVAAFNGSGSTGILYCTVVCANIR
jgi:hypothetical protein